MATLPQEVRDAWEAHDGPVPSRRLGRSLGIDLVPFKTCSYGYIYCQLGAVVRKPQKPAVQNS